MNYRLILLILITISHAQSLIGGDLNVPKKSFSMTYNYGGKDLNNNKDSFNKKIDITFKGLNLDLVYTVHSKNNYYLGLGPTIGYNVVDINSNKYYTKIGPNYLNTSTDYINLGLTINFVYQLEIKRFLIQSEFKSLSSLSSYLSIGGHYITSLDSSTISTHLYNNLDDILFLQQFQFNLIFFHTKYPKLGLTIGLTKSITRLDKYFLRSAIQEQSKPPVVYNSWNFNYKPLYLSIGLKYQFFKTKQQ